MANIQEEIFRKKWEEIVWLMKVFNRLETSANFIWLISFLIAVLLVLATRQLTDIPSDTQNLYMPAARALPFISHFSQMHESPLIPSAWSLCGKEATIAHFSFMQKLLHDTVSMFPFFLTCILAFAASAMLLFYVARGFWGERVALICYALFITSFWPYLYVLMVKHQPLGLMYFLLSVFFLQRTLHVFPPPLRGGLGRGDICAVLSGMSLGISLHASTIAPLFLPLYAGAYHCLMKREGRVQNTLAIAAGSFLALYFFAYPDFVGYWRGMAHYVQVSAHNNHFSYHQNTLKEWIFDPANTYGGWAWVFKYFLLVMPVLFPVYLGCAVYAFRKSPLMVFISFSPALFAVLSHAAQYGANYFVSLIGILCLIGYVLHKMEWTKARRNAVFVVLLAHVLVNVFVFFTDVYPCRMSSLWMARELQKLKTKPVYVHRQNPLTDKIIGQLPGRPVLFAMDNIDQARGGYIFTVPVAASSIYAAMPGLYTDFDNDIYLNELFRRNALSRYAVASFKTMASSKIWRQEEEILSYRDLMLNHFPLSDDPRNRSWILDADRLRADKDINAPSAEYEDLVNRGARNVGTIHSVYHDTGMPLKIKDGFTVAALNFKMYKIGDPKDELKLYVYKMQTAVPSPTWKPWGEFASLPVDGSGLTSDLGGEKVTFRFLQPQHLTAGDYHIVVYRTGKHDDQNFYRIFINEN